MRLSLSPNRNGGIGRQLAFIGLLGLLFACTDTSDPKVIDFKKTIAVARPGEGTSSQPLLRVAVGAMVSPKETFVHYRQEAPTVAHLCPVRWIVSEDRTTYT